MEWGPPVSTDVVRAALTSRLAGMGAGGSGATEAAVDVLVAMLNAGVHPVVPELGSVGAADIPQMAAVGLVAIGKGFAEYSGEVLPGMEALARAGIEPLVLEPKDGLALMSANSISIGQGALVARRAEELARAADVAIALSMEATHGNPSMMMPVVGEAKPFVGQIEACESMRGALKGSYLLDGNTPESVQNPLSFRVGPQVHGAFRELLAFATQAVEVELSSRSDNPLVDIGSQTIVHNGNFHPMVLALAFDALRIGIAHVGQLSERRMSHLWDAFFKNLESFTSQQHASSPAPGGSAPNGASSQDSEVAPPSPPPGVPEFFGLSLRYSAAALVAELKQLASPATLDVPPLDMGVEDHSTGAPLSVRKTQAALELLADILTIELLLAHDIVSMAQPRPALGERTGAACRAIDDVLSSKLDQRTTATIHRTAREQVLRAI